MKEKIAEMLYYNLGAVYCYSCEHENTEDEACDYCDRKSMGWSLSRKAADGLAEEIMKIINEGKFSGMPFYDRNLPINVPMFSDSKPYMFNECYQMTGIMDRHIAEQLQSVMVDNKTLFTDMMDEYNTECLIFRIE